MTEINICTDTCIYLGFSKKMQSELVDGSVILKYPISDYLSKKQRKNRYFIRITNTLKLTAFKQQLKDKSAKHRDTG